MIPSLFLKNGVFTAFNAKPVPRSTLANVADKQNVAYRSTKRLSITTHLPNRNFAAHILYSIDKFNELVPFPWSTPPRKVSEKVSTLENLDITKALFSPKIIILNSILPFIPALAHHMLRKRKFLFSSFWGFGRQTKVLLQSLLSSSLFSLDVSLLHLRFVFVRR